MRFGVLGPLEVSGQDGPLSLGGPKQRIVLAHLVLGANQVVSAEQLIDALWGEDLPDDPRSDALQVYVSRLRSVARTSSASRRTPRATSSGPSATRWTPSGSKTCSTRRRANGHEPRATDRILTEALGALARARVRGPRRASPRWPGEIARLEELRLQAMEEKIDAELDLGHHANVVAELESADASRTRCVSACGVS